MKKIVYLSILFSVFSCQESSWVIPVDTPLVEVKIDTSNMSEQNALGYWLLSQPQFVRDDFKRDFTFSGQEMKAFVDSLKIHDSIIHH